MKLPRLLAVVLVGLASACTSAPVRYYTLVRPLERSAQPALAACCDVQVKVSIPADVDRPELLRRSGDAEVEILSNDQWLAPLRDEIRSALVSEIHLQLAQPVARRDSAPWNFAVQVDVTRFEAVPGGEVLVSADWRFRTNGVSRSTLRCAAVAQYPAGLQVVSSVQGYQRAVSDIADRIAQGMLRALQGDALDCPSG